MWYDTRPQIQKMFIIERVFIKQEVINKIIWNIHLSMNSVYILFSPYYIIFFKRHFQYYFQIFFFISKLSAAKHIHRRITQLVSLKSFRFWLINFHSFEMILGLLWFAFIYLKWEAFLTDYFKLFKMWSHAWLLFLIRPYL